MILLNHLFIQYLFTTVMRTLSENLIKLAFALTYNVILP